VSRLRRSVVRVDHAAEHLPAQYQRSKGHDDRLVMIGRPPLPGLVRPVPDKEPERADPVGEAHDQVAGLLGGPGAVRVPGHPEDVPEWTFRGRGSCQAMCSAA